MNDLTPAYVAALEKQNRLLRRLTAACLGLLLVAVACGARQIAGAVVQDEFVLKDRNGTTRFEMVIDDNGGLSNGFHIADANGQTRIDMGVTEKGQAVILFLDQQGRVVGTLP